MLGFQRVSLRKNTTIKSLPGHFHNCLDLTGESFYFLIFLLCFSLPGGGCQLALL